MIVWCIVWCRVWGFLLWLLVVFSNTLGALLALLGIIMLVTPGQGLLTLFVGLLLMNFPGKHKLEQAFASHAGVMSGMNWLRRRWAREPFILPGSDMSGD